MGGFATGGRRDGAAGAGHEVGAPDHRSQRQRALRRLCTRPGAPAAHPAPSQRRPWPPPSRPAPLWGRGGRERGPEFCRWLDRSGRAQQEGGEQEGGKETAGKARLARRPGGGAAGGLSARARGGDASGRTRAAHPMCPPPRLQQAAQLRPAPRCASAGGRLCRERSPAAGAVQRRGRRLRIASTDNRHWRRLRAAPPWPTPHRRLLGSGSVLSSRAQDQGCDCASYSPCAGSGLPAGVLDRSTWLR